jgi:GT2 family glycosyltransferase
MKKCILVSVPNTGYVHKHVAFALLKLQKDSRYDLTIIMPTHNPFENNLHHIVKDFLAGGYDYWLSFDSDNPPMNNPLNLVEFGRDIIGCPTPVWHFDGKHKGDRPIYWNAYDYVPEKDAYKEHGLKEGLQKVDAIGTGCFLIARRVFLNEEMQKGVFTRKLYPDGRVEKGNDISFCERAREQGFEIYSHYDYPCMHFNELELNEVVRAFRSLRK